MKWIVRSVVAAAALALGIVVLAAVAALGGGNGGCSTPAAPVNAQGFTPGQEAFGGELASRTGLDAGVVGAWLLVEQNDTAAQARQPAASNDWLNIAYTGAAIYGAGNAICTSPITAADATAAWIAGQPAIPGYGTVSAGIQAILATVGQPASAQMAAIQGSGSGRDVKGGGSLN